MDDSLSLWADAFAAALKAEIEIVRRLVSNAAVLGAFAEALVRERVRLSVGGLRIATGAILHGDKQPLDVPQIDTIFWSTMQEGLPPLLLHDDFALVPQRTARGILEIKKSISSVPAFKDQLKRQQDMLQEPRKRAVLGLVLHHPTELSNEPCDGNGPEQWPHDRWNVRRLREPAYTNLLTGDAHEVHRHGVVMLGGFLGFMASQL